MKECQRGVFLQMNYSRAWKRRRLSATVRLMIFARDTRSYSQREFRSVLYAESQASQ